MFNQYAEIALRLPLQRTFTYLLPDETAALARQGMRVRLQFNNRAEEGVICSIHGNQPDRETLAVEGLLDPEPVVSIGQIEMAFWMADYYLAGVGECLYKMFPQGRRFPGRRSPRSGAVPATTDHVPRHELNLEQRPVFEIAAEQIRRNAFEERVRRNGFAREGDATRGGAANSVNVATAVGGTASRRPFIHLVHGITGSGKTEIYIHLILEALKLGLGALLLVPEISLTVQLIERLREIFGDDLALLHSGLKITERFGAYIAVLRGEKRIAVGTRSAVFAPVDRPGVIILDEEHDPSYKEHSAPRYHARQIAYRRAQRENAVLLLGSAAPGVESRHAADQRDGFFSYHRLESRAAGARLPRVETIKIDSPDVPISGILINEIEHNLKKKQQTLLLLNRRGYHPYMYCTVCEQSVVCPNCSVTLNLHRDGRLLCHYCSHERPDSGKCDRCGSSTVRLGVGTQKLEEYLFRLFPDIRLERLDTDSAVRRDAVRDCIGRLLSGELDVLLGTQMISKGLDAPNVSLVGVLQADLGLNMPDFRAAERTFALLTQVAGRAGRGDVSGRVFFETMNPDNRIIQYAVRQDYDSFYEEEIRNREQAFYPPFCRLVRLLYRSESESAVRDLADSLAELLHGAFAHETGPRPLILGPAPAPISRLHNQHRRHIVIKTLQPNAVRRALRDRMPAIRKLSGSRAYLEIDFDPVDMF